MAFLLKAGALVFMFLWLLFAWVVFLSRGKEPAPRWCYVVGGVPAAYAVGLAMWYVQGLGIEQSLNLLIATSFPPVMWLIFLIFLEDMCLALSDCRVKRCLLLLVVHVGMGLTAVIAKHPLP